jgi:tetratricopeptide (TPR) repeat protein
MKKKLTSIIVWTLLLISTNVLAEIKTYTHTVKQPFGGSQSPDDARVAAVAKAKREVLEKAGTYVESLTIVKNSMVEKDEIIALTAGVVKAEIVFQKNYHTEDAFGIIVLAKVDINTSIFEVRVKKLLQDRELLGKYQESQDRIKELLAKIEMLEEKNRKLQITLAKGQGEKEAELKKQFHKTTQELTASALYQRALNLFKNGEFIDPNQALNYLNRAIRIDSRYSHAYNLRGIAYITLVKYRQAIEDFDKAIQLSPKNAWTYNNRGRVYHVLREYQRAIEYFDKAISLNPKYATAYSNRGSAYRELSKYQRAIEDFDKAIQLSPKLAMAYNNRGKAYDELGQYKLADSDYNKAISLNPKYAQTYGGGDSMSGVSNYEIDKVNLFPIKVNKKFGYIDRTGKIIVKPQYDAGDELSHGMASINVGNKYGFLDATGELVIEPKYNFALSFYGDGYALVRSEEDNWMLINKVGDKLTFPKNISRSLMVDEGLVSIIINRKYGFSDLYGKIVIEPKFDQTFHFSEGLASVKLNKKWGYIDKNGEMIIEPQFDRPSDFIDSLSVVSINEKYGYIDKTGRVVIDFKFEDASSFSSGLAVVSLNKKWGYIDKTGKTVIDFKFENAGDFSSGLANVRINNKWGFIDKSGTMIINPQFDWSNEFRGGLAQVWIGKKIGYINISGKYVWEPTR